MATILYLRLDASYDPVFDPNVALQDVDAVNQAVQTRLLLLQGEWWENLNEGTPLFQQILGIIKQKAGSQSLASLALSARISGTPFVTAVQNVTAVVDATRKLSFSAKIQTIFGVTQVNVSPGSQASLGK